MWKTLTAGVALVCVRTEAFAQKDIVGPPVRFMTDLVPQSAVGALLFRNVNELKKRGDEVAAELGMRGAISMIGFMVGSELGLSGLIDDDRPCGAIWFEREFVNGTRSGLHPIAVAVAVKDLDAVAERFDIERDALERGDVTERKGKVGYEKRFCKLVGDYVWLASQKSLFQTVIERKPLTEMIPESRRAAVLASDILLAGNAASTEAGSKGFVREANSWVDQHKDLDPEEKEAAREFFSAFSAATWGMISARVDRGLAFDFDVFFDPKHYDAIETVLRRFNPSRKPSTLRGLPDAELLVAHAAHIAGEGSLPVMAVLAREATRNFSPPWRGFDQRAFLTEAQQLDMLGLFGEVWGHVQAYRMAMYRNPKPELHGITSLVAVLDSRDAADLVTQMRELAGLVDGTGLPLNAPGEDPPAATQQLIRELVRKLGDRSYCIRQSATVRLTLIGEPALSMVEAAELSKSLEVRRRATRIAARIRLKVNEAREEALKPGLIREAKPTFVFHGSAEQRVGHAVHVIEMQTAPGSKFEQQLRVLLGPGWRQIRLAPVGEHLVVLFGSDVSLLDRTLKNIDDDSPGLATDHGERIATAPLHPKRGAEFRVGIARILRLLGVKVSRNIGIARPVTLDDPKDAQVSGVGLTVQRDFVSLQWRVSLPDLKRARQW